MMTSTAASPNRTMIDTCQEIPSFSSARYFHHKWNESAYTTLWHLMATIKNCVNLFYAFKIIVEKWKNCAKICQPWRVHNGLLIEVLVTCLLVHTHRLSHLYPLPGLAQRPQRETQNREESIFIIGLQGFFLSVCLSALMR